jgi:hypothetical protein
LLTDIVVPILATPIPEHFQILDNETSRGWKRVTATFAIENRIGLQRTLESLCPSGIAARPKTWPHIRP